MGTFIPLNNKHSRQRKKTRLSLVTSHIPQLYYCCTTATPSCPRSPSATSRMQTVCTTLAAAIFSGTEYSYSRGKVKPAREDEMVLQTIETSNQQARDDVWSSKNMGCWRLTALGGGGQTSAARTCSRNLNIHVKKIKICVKNARSAHPSEGAEIKNQHAFF